MLKVIVVIPCFNEQESILDLVNELTLTAQQITDYKIDYVIVNDCSTDQTKNILIKNKVNFLDLPVNLGIGGAMQTGFKYAFLNGYDIAVQMDGDGQHPPSELTKILDCIKNNVSDVAIGSRFIDKEGFQSTQLRRIGITLISRLNKVLVGMDIKDCTSGYRALNRKALEVVIKYYPDEYPEPESVILFAFNNIRMAEVPVLMRERQGGVSSIRSFSSLYYMFKVYIANLFLYLRLK
jgi:glycosyltransferase involved in cell wall biosynthesis